MCGTWGQAATMPTMPASAFCGRIPKGIQLIKGKKRDVLGPSGLTRIPGSVAAEAPVTLLNFVTYRSCFFIHMFSVILYCADHNHSTENLTPT